MAQVELLDMLAAGVWSGTQTGLFQWDREPLLPERPSPFSLMPLMIHVSFLAV
jgi:hypothetical protein